MPDTTKRFWLPLTHKCVDIASLHVRLNGQLQRQGVDYRYDSAGIVIPDTVMGAEAGDELSAHYAHVSEPAPPPDLSPHTWGPNDGANPTPSAGCGLPWSPADSKEWHYCTLVKSGISTFATLTSGQMGQIGGSITLNYQNNCHNGTTYSSMYWRNLTTGCTQAGGGNHANGGNSETGIAKYTGQVFTPPGDISQHNNWRAVYYELSTIGGIKGPQGSAYYWQAIRYDLGRIY